MWVAPSTKLIQIVTVSNGTMPGTRRAKVCPNLLTPRGGSIPTKLQQLTVSCNRLCNRIVSHMITFLEVLLNGFVLAARTAQMAQSHSESCHGVKLKDESPNCSWIMCGFISRGSVTWYKLAQKDFYQRFILRKVSSQQAYLNSLYLNQQVMKAAMSPVLREAEVKGTLVCLLYRNVRCDGSEYRVHLAPCDIQPIIYPVYFIRSWLQNQPAHVSRGIIVAILLHHVVWGLCFGRWAVWVDGQLADPITLNDYDEMALLPAQYCATMLNLTFHKNKSRWNNRWRFFLSFSHRCLLKWLWQASVSFVGLSGLTLHKTPRKDMLRPIRAH